MKSNYTIYYLSIIINPTATTYIHPTSHLLQTTTTTNKKDTYIIIINPTATTYIHPTSHLLQTTTTTTNDNINTDTKDLQYKQQQRTTYMTCHSTKQHTTDTYIIIINPTATTYIPLATYLLETTTTTHNNINRTDTKDLQYKQQQRSTTYTT